MTTACLSKCRARITQRSMGFSTRTPSYLNDSADLAVLSLVSQVPGSKSCRQSGVNFQIRGSAEPAQLQLYVNATGFGWDFSVGHVPGTTHKLSRGHVHVAGFFLNSLTAHE